MGLTALYGIGSGALHAVTGPDHLLTLGPVALHRPARPFQVGLSWGLGHALGTVILGALALVFARSIQLAELATYGERLAGAALLGTAAWSARRSRVKHTPASAPDGSPFIVGVVHGLTGAASLLLMLPVVVSGSTLSVCVFLAAFAVGSTIAMGLVTTLFAKVGSGLGGRVVQRSQNVLLAASVALGLWWLVIP